MIDVNDIIKNAKNIAKIIFFKDIKLLNPSQLYYCVSKAIMGEVYDNMLESRKKHLESRRAYYFSAEFLMGRMTDNNLLNLGILGDLKEHLKSYLLSKGYQVVDKTEDSVDFVDSADRVCKGILEDEGDRAILIDAYGVGSFIAANKHKGIICAQVSDEHSAFMTRNHNNTSVITLGSKILGQTLAENIVDSYLESEYAGGRHQIRVDMLNKML